MAATAARGKAAVRGLTVLEHDGGQSEPEAPAGPNLGLASNVVIVSAIAVTQLAWMAALAYVLLWLVM